MCGDQAEEAARSGAQWSHCSQVTGVSPDDSLPPESSLPAEAAPVRPGANDGVLVVIQDDMSSYTEY